MSKVKKLTIQFLMTIAVGYSGTFVLTESASAQRQRRIKSSRPKPAVQRNDIPIAMRRIGDNQHSEDKTDAAIKAACVGLRNIIKTANASFSEFPYYQNSLTDNFEDLCIDGNLSWRSTRITAPDDPIKETDVFDVSFRVLDLDLGRLDQSHGRVQIVTKLPEIAISSNSKLLEWWIDLRASKHAEPFIEYVRTLYTILEKKAPN